MKFNDNLEDNLENRGVFVLPSKRESKEFKLLTPSNVLYYYRAELIRVVDGDTFVIDLDFGLNMWSKYERVRPLDFNTPENKTRVGKEITAKVMAKIARGSELIIHTRTNKRDSFGRLLADVYYEGEDITEWDFLKEYKLK